MDGIQRLKTNGTLAALGLALLVVAFLTPLVFRLALHLGAVAHPGGRHVHQRTIPRLGGLAICAAFYAALVGVWFVTPDLVRAFLQPGPYPAVGLVVGGILMCAVGVIDDARGIRAIHKLY